MYSLTLEVLAGCFVFLGSSFGSDFDFRFEVFFVFPSPLFCESPLADDEAVFWCVNGSVFEAPTSRIDEALDVEASGNPAPVLLRLVPYNVKNVLANCRLNFSQVWLLSSTINLITNLV